MMDHMKIWALIGAAAILALPLAWIGGELHRENCQHAGQQGCNVLPWSGHHPKPLKVDYHPGRDGIDWGKVDWSAGQIDWSKVKVP
jgi:hypothetical protein